MLALDAGTDAGPSIDAGHDSGSVPDAGHDAGPEPDAGHDEATYILGAPGADCDTTCSIRRMTCAGSGTVGTDCGQHSTVMDCSRSGYWIYRDHPITPPPHCRNSWGTSHVCNNNYNGSNAFCCRCL